jgi:uncharacterized protein YbjT (DUF2867 family)
MKILVTGATGYLGAIAAEALAVASSAIVGGASGDQAAFARDGEAVRATREAITDHRGALIFGWRRNLA